MSEKSLTLLELHLDDSRVQLGPQSLSAGRSSADDADGDGDVDVIDGPDESGDEGDGGIGGVGKALLAGLVVVTLALAVWKLLGKDDLEAVAELDERVE